MFKMIFAPTPGWIKKVEKNGIPALALVMSDPSHILDGVPHYEGRDGWLDVQVEVYPDVDPPFEAKMKCRLSQALFGMLGPGMKVNVRYDSKEPQHVLLVDDANKLLSYRLKK